MKIDLPRMILPAILFASCTKAEDKLDVLFVIDNSPTMYTHASSIALEIEVFLAELEGSVDLQIGLTTTTVDWSKGGELPRGVNGTLGGDVPVIGASTTDDMTLAFQRALLCDLVAWPDPCVGGSADSCVSSDSSYVCEEPASTISTEYLDCLCGTDWQASKSGSGIEEGLEATLLSLCRARPETGIDPILDEVCRQRLVGDEPQSNVGLLRDDARPLVVIVTNEGDFSDDVTMFGPKGSEDLYVEAEADVGIYLDLVGSSFHEPVFAVLGPYYEDGKLVCNSSSVSSWSILRYENISSGSGGFYTPLVQPTDDYSTSGVCVLTAVSDFYLDLARLSIGL